MPGRRSATANSNSRRTALPIRSLSSPAVVPAKAGTQDHRPLEYGFPLARERQEVGLKSGFRKWNREVDGAARPVVRVAPSSTVAIGPYLMITRALALAHRPSCRGSVSRRIAPPPYPR